MMLRSRHLVPFLAVLLSLSSISARAEPYLALQQGYKCSSCHVNPTGGGLRNEFGNVFARTVLPMHPTAGGALPWAGALGEYARVGGDLRANWSGSYVPGQPRAQQNGIDPLRLYASIAPWPGHVSFYVDGQLTPGDPNALESYGRLDLPGAGLYLKAGQFYLPFGWRLQDQTALVREASGISMTSPDRGVELGYDRGDWSAQLDLTRGAANLPSGAGHQVTGQLAWVQARYRVGAASSFTESPLGNRSVNGAFAGLRSGPVAWLGELDIIRDAGYPEGTRTLAAALGEVDWNFSRGQNLKLTAEYYDPDRKIAEDQKTRWSLLYEFTPLPYVQLRAGYRRYRGIPQNDTDNRRAAFVELHAWF
jgi:hypothetical protein